MDLQIVLGLILSVLPVFEIRGGLPLIIEHAIRNDISIWPYSLAAIILNILVIFFIFFFLDFLHDHFMRLKPYRRLIGKTINRTRRKVEKIDNKNESWKYVALLLLVAIPLPGTGAWTGSFISWTLGLKRMKSYIAISIGVILAGIIVLFASLGLFSSLY